MLNYDIYTNKYTLSLVIYYLTQMQMIKIKYVNYY